jgi:two-component system nitrogen regulation response regulator GlnG
VRELRHVLEYAASVSRGGSIFLSHLPSHVSAMAQDPAITPTSGELDSTLERWLSSQLAAGADLPSYDALLDHVEAAMLRHLLNRFQNKPTHLAASLRMNRATLRQKLRRAGLQREEEG